MCFPADSYAVAGEVIATYHYHEAEVEKAPAIVGYTALLAASEGQYRVRPCGYRYYHLLLHTHASLPESLMC